INFDQPTARVHNFVRGLSPYPGAWTRLQGKLCKVFQTAVGSPDADTNAAVGSWATDGKTHLRFRTADGWLDVLELQLEGKKRLKTEEFLRGNPLRF
ncbi:MAG: methionyl-tRNA formyltransferase, partial [Cytophagales bacterium]|nr:methionyl-tRNA formyltransferase [Cytophagales bacterium]